MEIIKAETRAELVQDALHLVAARELLERAIRELALTRHQQGAPVRLLETARDKVMRLHDGIKDTLRVAHPEWGA